MESFSNLLSILEISNNWGKEPCFYLIFLSDLLRRLITPYTATVFERDLLI